MPAFTDLADAAVAALLAAGVAGGNVYHVIPAEAALGTSYVTLRVDAGAPDRGAITGAPVDWTTALRVECYSRFGVKNPRPHEAVTQLFADVYAVLMADTTLGGQVLDIEPGPVSWDYADEELQSAIVQAQFAVLHRTQPLTAEAA